MEATEQSSVTALLHRVEALEALTKELDERTQGIVRLHKWIGAMAEAPPPPVRIVDGRGNVTIAPEWMQLGALARAGQTVASPSVTSPVSGQFPADLQQSPDQGGPA